MHTVERQKMRIGTGNATTTDIGYIIVDPHMTKGVGRRKRGKMSMTVRSHAHAFKTLLR